MIRRFHKKDNRTQKLFYRRNEQIPAQTLRVLDIDGKQIGVLSKVEAIAKARELGLDLVEIAAAASPVVAKIVDYNKFLYQESKKKQEEKKRAKVSETKEVRLGPFMSENDLDTMIRRAQDFLDGNDKVRLVVKFSGRQIAHPEFGHKIIQKVIKTLSDRSKIDREPHLEGRQLIAILTPEKKKHGKTENQESSQQAL